MLAAFIDANREEILRRTAVRVADRLPPDAPDMELPHGIPVFLDQLTQALRAERSGEAPGHADIRASARRHGRDLLSGGLSIAQVVRNYGDVCQVVTEMAIEHEALIGGEDFRTLNLCLDDAIAEAVTAYSLQRERQLEDQGTERLGVLAHEMRNLINTAILTFDTIRSGRVAVAGSTGLVHSRSLLGLRDLVVRSLADVRLDAGIQRFERTPVADLLEEVEIGAQLQAEAHEVALVVGTIGRGIEIQADGQILAAALANLLNNAFRFTPKHGHVSLTTSVTDERVLFEVADECGGLPPGKISELFRPFVRGPGGHERGMGLGLSICSKAAKAHRGEIRVRDLPGKGCVFTLDVPRAAII